MLNLVGRKLGKYQIMQQIGYIGLMTTYRVYGTGGSKHYAMKVLAGDLMGASVMDSTCFLREVGYLARLKHPNLLAVVDHGIEDGVHFWVTELIDGRELSYLLSERGPLPLSQAADISVQVLDALYYLHSQDILHRDIRPSNIFVLANGKAVLDDIGLNLVVEKCVRRDARMEGVVGTPIYMSPEEVNRGETDHRSDLYTFGVVLYKMVTGRVPFDDYTTPALMMAKLQHAIPSPRRYNSDIPEGLELVLLKVLNEKPDDRFQSAAEMAEAIRNVYPDSAPSATPFERRKLHEVLEERFDREELHTLCFDLDVDYYSLPGEGKSAKARELITYLERRNDLSRLIEAIRRKRGSVI